MSWHKMAFCIAWYGIYCKVWWYRMPEFRSVLFLYSLFLKNQGNGKYWNWQFSMKMFFFACHLKNEYLTICLLLTAHLSTICLLSFHKKVLRQHNGEKISIVARCKICSIMLWHPWFVPVYYWQKRYRYPTNRFLWPFRYRCR